MNRTPVPANLALMNYSDPFDKGVKKWIGFAKADCIEDVPTTPGIYAWYLPLAGDDTGGLQHFLSTLQSDIKNSAPATRVTGEGRQRMYSIERTPPKFDFASTAIEGLQDELSGTQLEQLAKLVLYLSFLNEPIYIGMTKSEQGLRGRLKQHLQEPKTFEDDEGWHGAFNSRIAKKLSDKTFLRRCVIAFMPIAELELGGNAPRVLEHILIRTIRPAQSERG